MKNEEYKTKILPTIIDRIFVLVEARGVEPLSESLFLQLSPSAVHLLEFPWNSADEQAMFLGSSSNTQIGTKAFP